MADYSRYKLETLKKMLDKAEEKLNAETIKPVGHWGDGMRLAKLPSIAAWERASDRVAALKQEIRRREEEA